MTVADSPLAGRDGQLAELVPLLRRVTRLDMRAVVRVRLTGEAASALLRLPFGVLVGRTVESAGPPSAVDTTVGVAPLVAWLEGAAANPPPARDDAWRGASPPPAGWQRVETVPDDVVRRLVRAGALALKEAAEREGVPGAQPRAEVADALLDSVVLTADGGPGRAEVRLRTLSAVTRMGFLPRGGQVAIDVAGRWVRVAAPYGTAYAERDGLSLAR